MKQITIHMKHFLFALFMFFAMAASAQEVSYIHKALSAKGCVMKYSVVKQDSSYYIIANVISDRMSFLPESTMKIRTFNDEVITLKGTAIANGGQSIGVVSGNIVIPVTAISSTAQFSITPEEFEMLNNGVSKVRLTMTPTEHEHTFKIDKIGKKLYKFYLKVKAENDNF